MSEPARGYDSLRHPVAIGTLNGPTRLAHTATAPERDGLARELGILGIDALSGEFVVEPKSDGRVLVSGRVRAEVRQACVVTLEPVQETIDEPVDLVFAPPDLYAKLVGEIPEEAGIDLDPPERLEDGAVDLGAVMGEFLALGLAPYPRAPGATFESGEEPGKDSPFAALGKLLPEKKPE